MHRLTSARNLYQSSFHGISLTSNNSVKRYAITDIKCSFCRRILMSRISGENTSVARHQSTKPANLPSSTRKKKHKTYKKYGELLEVGDQAMTETKVSISKLRAVHLSKLATSSVSLGQLHQLTTKSLINSKVAKVDPELLQTVKEKILKKSSVKSFTPAVENTSKIADIVLEDDKCALIFTSHALTNIEDKLKTKQYIDMVKDSYYNFRKATIYDQRLQDLRYAISEGVTQELNFNEVDRHNSSEMKELDYFDPLPKGPHAVFRELFVDNHLDSYDQELMSHITNIHAQGLAHPAIEDIYEDSALHSEIADPREDLDFDTDAIPAKALKIKEAKKAIRDKNKAKREKRRAKQELNMKQDMKDLERRGKQESLHRVLTAHLQLLCSLDMVKEAHQVLQYYRQRCSRTVQHPKIHDVNIYNTLLHGYAKAGMLSNAEVLLSHMSQDSLQMNAQTYAAMFECIERSNNANKLALLIQYNKEMVDKNITLNDVLDKTKFLYDQRQIVLQAIRKLQPSFEPQYTPPVLDYSCPLLDKLTLNHVENRQGLMTSPSNDLVPLEEMIKRGKEQIQIEMKGEVEIQNIGVLDEQSSTVVFCRAKLKETQKEWRSVIQEAFVRNLGTLKSQSCASHSAITLYPYLKVLKVEQFVDLIMSEISKLVDGSETYSPTLKVLQRELGTQVYQKYQMEQYRNNGILEKTERIYEKYCEWYVTRKSVDGTDLPYNGRQAWQQLVHLNREGPSLDIEEMPWPMEMRQNVGKFLYNIIINDVKIDVNMFKPKAKVKKLPAVYKVHRPWARTVRLELKPHPVLARAWVGACTSTLRMRAALVPARAPPAPWRSVRAGAALLTPPPLIRMPYYVMSQWKRIEEAPTEALYPVLDSLNQLGEVPWVINKPILDLQIRIFRAGGNKKLDIAPPSSALDVSQFAHAAGARADAADTFKRRVALNRARAEMHSLWCDALYKLSLANHYRDAPFWLAQNLDFRGRVYACGPHVSALGADAQRALLRLARARPLGVRGLHWLKLHAVNLTGTMKKSTVEERLAHADSIMDKILDSADKPLDGEGWWMQSEEPWQTLACCMEIANAVRSPNPEEYECGFPVHQDGSCNGLQHYAALGGDAPGAAAVNLAPAPRPQDVYSAVAALVEEMRARDAAAGVPAALILENFVRRKVIKQTVMTTVYGVTKFGARLQIAKQLKDIEEFPKEHVWSCSQYLTAKTFDSLREMFTSTKLIQDWFTDCAKVISGVCGESVEWVTPLGLRVVQPYYRRAGPHARAPVELQQRPCTMKQRNAFPPNFIHSLDSSHMMLTALHCEARGLAFVSVHDCFWTHPCSVDDMNKICREQFVALHSQPILEDLSAFMVQRYSYAESELEDHSVGAANKKRVNNLLQKVPSKGDFDIRSVLKSVYFFS